MFSACSYGELSTRIPSAGSSYAYVYVGLGEYFAVIAAWCLSLEYGISGAAVARSWGDKLAALVCRNRSCVFLSLGYGINALAGLLQFATMLVLLCGIEVGKLTVNVFTIFKVMLVIFMITYGLLLFDVRNIPTWTPMGASGVMRGATSCFFGYIGYDEVLGDYIPVIDDINLNHLLMADLGLLHGSGSKEPTKESSSGCFWNCIISHCHVLLGGTCFSRYAKLWINQFRKWLQRCISK